MLLRRRSLLGGVGLVAATVAQPAMACDTSVPLLRRIGNLLIPSAVACNPPPTSAAPAQAAAAGFNTLAFFDDFTSNTVSGNQSITTVQPGLNWYPGTTGGNSATLVDPTNYHMQIGSFATGSNASVNGGLVQIFGHPTLTNQNTIACIPHALYGTNYSGVGAFGPFMYIEGYCMVVSGQTQHTAFWTNQTGDNGGNITEYDLMESNQGGTPNIFNSGTVHTFPYPAFAPDTQLAGTPTSVTTADSNWHTWGILITNIGAGQGHFSCYKDNVLSGAVVTVGSGTNASAALLGPSYISLGKVFGADAITFDWVKVWTAP
jgi:hypothetical protein